MAWRRPGDKPVSEPMIVSLLTYKCVTRPQWVTEILLKFHDVCIFDMEIGALYDVSLCYNSCIYMIFLKLVAYKTGRELKRIIRIRIKTSRFNEQYIKTQHILPPHAVDCWMYICMWYYLENNVLEFNQQEHHKHPVIKSCILINVVDFSWYVLRNRKWHKCIGQFTRSLTKS